MVTVIVSHEVNDFTKWKSVFDNHEPVRRDAKMETLGVYRSVDNSNMVTIIVNVPDAATMQAFMTNPDMEKVMKESGVISAPEVKILQKV